MKNHENTDRNADAPPRRRRSFLAARQSGNPEAGVRPLPIKVPADDIPVLTEIVHDQADDASIVPVSIPSALPPDSPAVSQTPDQRPVALSFDPMALPPAAPSVTPFIPTKTDFSSAPPLTADPIPPAAMEAVNAQSDELVDQMMQAIRKQMAYELPSLIEATLMSVSDELRTGIMATMDAALRDFTVNRKK